MNPEDSKSPYQSRGLDSPTFTPPGQPIQPQSTPVTTNYIGSSYITPESPATKPSKKLIIVAVGMLLVVLIAGLFFLLKPASPVTVTRGNIQFAYPGSWQTIDGSVLGLTTAYGDKADFSASTVVIGQKSTKIMNSKVPVADFNDTARQSIRADVVANIKAAVTAEDADCADFSLSKQTDIQTTTAFGIDVQFNCTNEAGVVTTEFDRYLYVGDGLLYQVSILAAPTDWNKNKTQLDAIIASIKAKA